MVSASEIQLEVNFKALPPPTRAYYANTATCVREGKLASFAFGQFQVGRRDAVQSAMGIDIPERSVGGIVRTFEPGFRETLRRLAADYTEMSRFPTVGEQPKSVIYPAHLVRVGISDMECALDFYTFGNIIAFDQGEATVESVMRIRCFAPVVQFFVSACDDIVKGER